MRKKKTGWKDPIASDFAAFLEAIPEEGEFTVDTTSKFCRMLEFYLPSRLSRRFPEWKRESLDGFYFASARKTGTEAARFSGTCILISDQTMTPFFLELSLSASGDSVASLRLLLGEKGGGKLGISGPEWGTKGAMELLENIPGRLDFIRWSYVLEEVSED